MITKEMVKYAICILTTVLVGISTLIFVYATKVPTQRAPETIVESSLPENAPGESDAEGNAADRICDYPDAFPAYCFGESEKARSPYPAQ